jgi:hypothetical protein
VNARWCAIAVLSLLAARRASAQADTLPRQLSARETGCVSPAVAPTDSVYDVDGVDEPVRPRRLAIEGMPFRSGEILTGRSVFRFIVEGSGRIDRCSIVVLEETVPSWTAAVVKDLRYARYQPARRGGRPVRQWVHQLFTYHSDGRVQERR